MLTASFANKTITEGVTNSLLIDKFATTNSDVRQ